MSRAVLIASALMLSGCEPSAAARHIRPAEREKEIKQLASFGVLESWSDSGGGQRSVSCSPKTKLCEVFEGQIGSDLLERGKKYVYHFNAAAWVDGRWPTPPSDAAITSYTIRYHKAQPPPGEHWCGSVIQPQEMCAVGGLEPDADDYKRVHP